MKRAILAGALAAAVCAPPAVAGWRPVQELPFGTSSDYGAVPAFDAAGTAYVGSMGEQGPFLLTTHPFGGDWTDVERAWGPIEGEEAAPALAVAADGTAFAALDVRDIVTSVVVVVRPPGGPFPAGKEVGEGGWPHLAANARGDAIVAWVRSDYPASGVSLLARTVSRRGVLGPAHRLVRGLETLTRDAIDVALDERGDAVVTWASAERGAFAAVRSASGSWKAPVRLTAPGEGGHGARVDVSADGRAVAVWGAMRGGDIVVRGARARIPTGSWSAPVRLSAQHGTAGGLAVAVDGAGRPLVAWVASASDDGGPVLVAHGLGGRVEQVSASEERGVWPDAAAAPGGAAVVAWRLAAGPNSRARAAAGTVDALEPAVTLASAGGSRYAAPPHVAVDARGNAAVAWCGPNYAPVRVAFYTRPVVGDGAGAWSVG